MAKKTYVKVGGVWKEVKNVWFKVGGVWKQKVIPKVKVSGVWKEVMQYILYLYNLGTANITWGMYQSSSTNAISSITYEASDIRFGFRDSSGGTLRHFAMYTPTTYDLTKINKITVELIETYLGTSQNTYPISLIASTTQQANDTVFNAKNTYFERGTITTTRTLVLDVSALSGNYYIRINTKNSDTIENYIKISKVFLE